MKPYDLDDATYKKISDILLAEMEKGLNKTTNAEAIVKMLPTYVRALPDGTGRFYTSFIELEGTLYFFFVLLPNLYMFSQFGKQMSFFFYAFQSEEITWR